MEEKLRYIYKFFSAKHEYNFKAVENGEVYLSDFTRFNDPLEFTMDIEYYVGEKQVALDYIKKKDLISKDGSSDTLSKKEYDTLDYQLSRYNLNSFGRNNYFEIMETKSTKFCTKINKVENNFYKKLKNRIDFEVKKNKAICCFTNLDRLDNYKMWNSYANGHNGFCVQYKIDKSAVQFELNRVIYSSNQIKIKKGSLVKYYNRLDDLDIIKNVKKAICRKELCWRDEKEYRIISSHIGLVKFYPIANVICGLKMKEKDIERMNSICKKLDIGCYCLFKREGGEIGIGTYYEMKYEKINMKLKEDIRKKRIDWTKYDKIKEEMDFYQNKYKDKHCPFTLWQDLKFFYEP